MARLSLWHSGLKSCDFKFFDRSISEMISVGGTIGYIHLYLGPYDQAPEVSDSAPEEPITGTTDPVVNIEDVLFLENRDRKYSRDVFELVCVYNVQDAEFDMRQFGLFLDNDTIFISFHYNDMVQKLGRKLVSGDVIEFPHLRDDYLLNNGPSVNKYYVVTDANRSSEGYSPTWWAHVWRCKVKPITASQEFSDILTLPSEDRFGVLNDNIGSLISDLGIKNGINEEVVEAARASVPARNFETQHIYVMAGDETCAQNPWIWSGDGIPPDGRLLSGQGRAYPKNPTEGEYFLRLDYEPHVLYRFLDGVWRRQELDYRKGDWLMAHRILTTFIQNDKTQTWDDRTIHPEKIALSKAIKPSADF